MQGPNSWNLLRLAQICGLQEPTTVGFQGSRLLTNYGHVQIWFHPRLTGVIWALLSHLLPTGSSSRWFVWGLVRTRWLSRNGVGALNLEPTHRCPDEIGDSKMSRGLRPNWLSHHLQLVSGTKRKKCQECGSKQFCPRVSPEQCSHPQFLYLYNGWWLRPQAPRPLNCTCFHPERRFTPPRY